MEEHIFPQSRNKNKIPQIHVSFYQNGLLYELLYINFTLFYILKKPLQKENLICYNSGNTRRKFPGIDNFYNNYYNNHLSVSTVMENFAMSSQTK